MLYKKYRIVHTIQFRRVKINYMAPCHICKLLIKDKYLCKSQFTRTGKSIFDSCLKACNVFGPYNYIHSEK